MARKVRLGTRLRYWFDNTMSRGTPSLVGWLAVVIGRNRAVTRLAGGEAVVIDADDISSRLVVQTARQSKLSVVYHDLLDFGGDEFYVIAEPRLAGRPFGQALLAYRKCRPVGIFHGGGTTTLNPPIQTPIGPDDKLVILAEDDSAIKLADRAFPVESRPMPAIDRVIVLAQS